MWSGVTTPSVAICIDELSLRNPSLVGLSEENLFEQPWLKVYTSANLARREISSLESIGEVWVVADEEIAPINVAATLKADNPAKRVCLLSDQETGSLKSRLAHTAVDSLLSQDAFIARYFARKSEYLNASLSRGNIGLEPSAQRNNAPGHQEGLIPQELHQKESKNKNRLVLSDKSDDGRTQARGWSAVQVKERSQPDSSDERAFVFPFVSGSGGTGKSTVSLLAAYLSQGLGYETLLIDCDWQFGDLATLTGAQKPLRIDEVYASPYKLQQLASNQLTPAFLAAPAHAEEAEVLAAGLSELIKNASRFFDVIVCNTGGFWAEQHAVLLEQASRAFFLVDQRTASIRSCHHAFELCSRCGIALGPAQVLVNRCGKQASFSAFEVESVLSGVPIAELREGGADVDDLLGAGLPLDLLASKNPLCLSLEKVLLEAIPGAGGESPGAEPPRQGRLLNLLRGRKKKGMRRNESRGVACL